MKAIYHDDSQEQRATPLVSGKNTYFGLDSTCRWCQSWCPGGCSAGTGKKRGRQVMGSYTHRSEGRSDRRRLLITRRLRSKTASPPRVVTTFFFFERTGTDCANFIDREETLQAVENGQNCYIFTSGLLRTQGPWPLRLPKPRARILSWPELKGRRIRGD
jgi:hypothetical protein